MNQAIPKEERREMIMREMRFFEHVKGFYFFPDSTHDKDEWFPKLPLKIHHCQWAAFFEAIIDRESGWRPDLTYQEKIKDRFGDPVISTGLFQVSYESAVLNHGCGLWLNKKEDLLIPHKNIRTGIKILMDLIKQDNRIAGKKVTGFWFWKKTRWFGGSRYFAVLRDSLRYSRESMEYIRSKTMEV
jgi:hypothetical protein